MNAFKTDSTNVRLTFENLGRGFATRFMSGNLGGFMPGNLGGFMPGNLDGAK
jgi:hypothetical protein